MFRRHKHVLEMAEKANRMLQITLDHLEKVFILVQRHQTDQRAMLNPQIDFISRQVLLVPPIQLP